MAWYDALPFRSAFKVPGDLASGNFGDAAKNTVVGLSGSDMMLGAKKYLYDDPADKQRGALNTASAAAHKLAEDQRAWYMKGLDQSLGHYAGADATYRALYGDPASLSKAPHGPQASPAPAATRVKDIRGGR